MRYIIIAVLLIGGGDKPVSIRLDKRAVVASSFRPATVTVTAVVYEHSQNRWWNFAYESTNGQASNSGGSMEGGDKLIVRDIKVYPGNYLFRVCVVRLEKKPRTYCADAELDVRGD